MACIQASYLLDSKKQDSKKQERAKRKVMVIASNSKALYSLRFLVWFILLTECEPNGCC